MQRVFRTLRATQDPARHLDQHEQLAQHAQAKAPDEQPFVGTRLSAAPGQGNGQEDAPEYGRQAKTDQVVFNRTWPPAN